MTAPSSEFDAPRNGDREHLLADLLVRLERSRETGECRTAPQILANDPAWSMLPGDDALANELERRLFALQKVDELLFPADDRPQERRPEIPGYEILGELDRGGMSVVLLARQSALDRKVVVKVLLAGQFADRRLRDRFRGEAATVARLRHPNIVQIHDSGEADGVPYLTLEWMAGGSLKTKISGRPWPPAEAARLVESISRAVDYAHQQGVVHRDLKPSNVLLSEEGVPKVADFGLAKLLDGAANHTRTGEMPGTPRYMAPEQIRGAHVGPGADIYALGAVLHEALTGQPPFVGESSAQILNQVLVDDPVPVGRLQPSIPRDLEVICQKCLEKDASARYPTAAALADDLRRFLLGEPIVARRHGPLVRTAKWARRRPAFAALVGVSLTAMALFWAATVWHARTLSDALLVSEQHRLQAEANELAAVQRERSLQHHRYAVRMQLADHASKKGNAKKVLAELAYYEDGQPESQLRGFEWYYLREKCHSDLATLSAHTNQVNFVTWSPDDTLLATASDDGTVNVWNGDSLELVSTLGGHGSCVNEIAFTPDGQTLVTASCDHTVRLWDVKSAAEVATLADFGKPVHWLAVSPDGRTIATPAPLTDEPHGQQLIALWDLATRERTLVGFAHDENATSAAFAPDGATLVTTHFDGAMRSWNTESGRRLRVLQGHVGHCLRVCFSTDGSYFVSVGADGYAMIWDAASYRKRIQCRTHGIVYDVSVSPDNSSIALACGNSNVEIFDSASGERRAMLIGHTDGVQSVGFQHDGLRLASGGRRLSPEIKIWDPTQASDSDFLVPLPNLTRTAAFSDDLQQFVTSNCIGRFSLWNVGTGRERCHGVKNGIDTHQLVYSQQTDWVVGPTPGGVAAWRPSTGNRTVPILNHTTQLSPVAFLRSESGGRSEKLVGYFVESSRCVATIWQMANWKLQHEVEVARLKEGDAVESVAVHPRGQWFATAISGDIVVSSLATGDPARRVRTPGWTSSLFFSDDGELLLWGSSDGAANIWNWQSENEIRRLGGHDGDVNSVALSPNRKTLASGDSRGNVNLWNMASGQQVLHLQTLDAPVTRLQWSVDGTALGCFCREIGGQNRAEARVWSIAR